VEGVYSCKGAGVGGEAGGGDCVCDELDIMKFLLWACFLGELRYEGSGCWSRNAYDLLFEEFLTVGIHG
jgi:hypothetical protein